VITDLADDGETPDVLPDMPALNVDDIHLPVGHLEVRVSLKAEAANMAGAVQVPAFRFRLGRTRVLSSILTRTPQRNVMSATLLVAVVADNLEDQAIEIIRGEGPQGVTMIPARGLNFPEHVTFFGLTYHGLETMLLALVDETTASRLAERLNEELKLLEPFQGLAFCISVSGTGGIDIGRVRKALARGRSGDTDGNIAHP